MIDESKINVGKHYDAESIQYKVVWNEAIEAAAKYFEDNIDDLGLTSNDIRKLKK